MVTIYSGRYYEEKSCAKVYTDECSCNLENIYLNLYNLDISVDGILSSYISEKACKFPCQKIF